MPSLGADMTEGTLLEWLVAPGDVVHRGDIVATVDTSKSAIDIEVFQDGRIAELLVEPGTTVPVGATLALLDDVHEEASKRTPPISPTTPKPEQPSNVVTPRPVAAAPVLPVPHVAASPLARRRAAELGIDLASVIGDGGIVSVADVEAAAHAPGVRAAASPSAPAPADVVAPEPAAAAADRSAAMREAIARLMARSKREIPHYYLQTTIDIHPSMEWLAKENAGRSVADRILPAALLVKAAAAAAREVPELNGFCVNGVFTPSEHIHVGVAVSLRGGGLIAPAIHDADRLSLAEVMAAMKDLVTRARSGRLRSSEMSDPTITVTNLGEQGAEAVHGVIYPPQVALVGFGRIVERPWAVDGMLAVRPVVTATLAADHRVTDGHRGGLFLAAVETALADPDALRGGSS